MKKLLFLLLFASLSTSAEPRHRFDKKFWLLTAVTIGSAFAASHTAHSCENRFGRDAGCFGGSYSSDKQKDGLRIGFTTGMVMLSYVTKRNEEPMWLWGTFQVVPLTWNTTTMVQNLNHKGCPVSICKDTR